MNLLFTDRPRKRLIVKMMTARRDAMLPARSRIGVMGKVGRDDMESVKWIGSNSASNARVNTLHAGGMYSQLLASEMEEQLTRPLFCFFEQASAGH